MPTAVCENCGSSDDDLVAVHRVYLEFDDGEVTGAFPVEEVERWCRACRATYPNEPEASAPST